MLVRLLRGSAPPSARRGSAVLQRLRSAVHGWASAKLDAWLEGDDDPPEHYEPVRDEDEVSAAELGVRCPRCDARAGEPCRDDDGTEAPIHVTRAMYLERALQEGARMVAAVHQRAKNNEIYGVNIYGGDLAAEPIPELVRPHDDSEGGPDAEPRRDQLPSAHAASVSHRDPRPAGYSKPEHWRNNHKCDRCGEPLPKSGMFVHACPVPPANSPANPSETTQVSEIASASLPANPSEPTIGSVCREQALGWREGAGYDTTLPHNPDDGILWELAGPLMQRELPAVQFAVIYLSGLDAAHAENVAKTILNEWHGLPADTGLGGEQ